jgi:hypothetical protein
MLTDMIGDDDLMIDKFMWCWYWCFGGGGRARARGICIIGTLFIKFNWIISDK